MPSRIKVDEIAGSSGNTITIPSGQTLDASSGTVTLPASALSTLNASNLSSGTVPSARLSLTSSDLPTVPTTKGGTGLTTIGTANQVLRVNSGASALEFGTISAGKLLQISTATASSSSSTTNNISGFSNGSVGSNPGVAHITISFTPTSATSKLVCFSTAPVGCGGNDMFATGIFHDGNCIAYSAGNAYSSDADSGTNIGIVNSTNTNARDITFRGIGSNGGSTLTMGGYRSVNTVQMTTNVYGSLTIMEIEP